ncbi:MAG: PAS domain S-box protein [Smithellaceae bacterium]|nr:PAS domain S-box protein [Smithellaceae bacterium]
MKKTVLIADDSSVNLYLLKSILETEGWLVREAENGKAALDIARAQRPDLIVSDILMPVMDGYSFCRECKKDETLCNIPFVFYTATYTEPKDEKFALDLGADRFILKPEEPEVLIKILTDLLEEKDRISLAASKPLGEEMEFFRRHNEILFSKLEKKMADLEAANSELRKLEEKYRGILENMADAYYEVDLKGDLTFFNQALAARTGYAREELMGMNYRQYVSRNCWRQVQDIFAQVYQTGRAVSLFDYEISLKDGGKRFQESWVNLILDKDNQPIGFRGMARDVTDRKIAEEELRQAEERYRSIYENAQEGMYRANADEKFIMVNSAMARIFGYDSPAEFVEQVNSGAHQLYQSREDRKKIFQLLESRGFVQEYEARFFRKDGSIGWVSVNIQPARVAEGQTLCYDGFVRDVTDRKESVERLREAFAGTIQAITSLVEAKDPYTAGHQRRVADIAQAIAVEMGLSREQMEGIAMAGIIHDIGKVSVPAEILCSPRRLTQLEFNLIKTHAQSGYEILKDIKFPWPIARMVLEHHERMDGSGYPHGLTGNNILPESRILAVADVVEAMATHRPYRAALGLEPALQEITKNRGVLFDEEAVDACLRLFREKGYTIKN